MHGYAPGIPQRAGLVHSHFDALDTRLLKTQISHALRQVLYQVARRSLDEQHNRFLKRLVVYGVFETVAPACVAEIDMKNDIQDDVLLSTSFLRVNAHIAA
jgi:hypothetical protein